VALELELDLERRGRSPLRRLRVPRVLTALSVLGLFACDPQVQTARPMHTGEIAVRVERVALDRGDAPVMILTEERGDRRLPIWIGSSEARSIVTQMAQRRESRPNGHDLTRNVIRGLDAEVLRVVVTELRADTYYATLALRVRDQIVLIDSRPSDAIAIALRADAPIFVSEHLFNDEQDAVISGDGPDGLQI